MDIYVGNDLQSVAWQYIESMTGAEDELLINNGDGTFGLRSASEYFVRAGDYGHSPFELTMSAAFADFDNDGDMDLLVGSLQTTPLAPSSPPSDDLPMGLGRRLEEDSNAFSVNHLWENDGHGTFSEVLGCPVCRARINGTVSMGIGDSNQRLGSYYYIAWGDVDNDNFPDVAVCRYPPTDAAEATIGKEAFCPCRLWHNDGDASFTDLRCVGNYPVFGDFDNDNKMDILAWSHNMTEGVVFHLWKGNADGTFVEIIDDTKVPFLSGTTYPLTTVPSGEVTSNGGVTIPVQLVDYDDDGDLDVSISIDELWTNHGDGTFTMVTPFAISSAMQTRYPRLIRNMPACEYDVEGDLIRRENCKDNWLTSGTPPVLTSMAWGDVDGDGRLDVVVGIDGGRNILFHNDGSGSFSIMTRNAITAPSGSTRSVTLTDFDNDGDADFVGVGSGTHSIVLVSKCSTGGNAVGGGCFSCPYYSARVAGGMDICKECPVNHVGGTGSGCVPCPPGTERLSGQSKCSACASGYFCDSSGVGPQLCEAGRYGDEDGRSDGKCNGVCSTGHYCPAGSTSSTAMPWCEGILELRP